MALRYEARTDADPATAWALLARPARWHEWAPHLRGARGLGAPEVEEGRRGAAVVLFGLPVPARIVAVRPGVSWTWRVGPVTLEHAVEPAARGCLVAVELRAPRPLEPLFAVTYGPLVALLVRNLARVAAADARRVAT